MGVSWGTKDFQIRGLGVHRIGNAGGVPRGSGY